MVKYEMIWTENGFTSHIRKIEAETDAQAERIAEALANGNQRILGWMLEKTTVQLIKKVG
jgi:hypothetical protein